MTSMRVCLSQMKANKSTHCLIEWDEPGNPISVVESKNVKSVESDQEPLVGDKCTVQLRERSKIVKYPGKLLARGTKKDMELEMARLDNMNWSDEDSACEESDEEGQPPKKRRRQAAESRTSKKKSTDADKDGVGNDEAGDGSLEGGPNERRKRGQQIAKGKKKADKDCEVIDNGHDSGGAGDESLEIPVQLPEKTRQIAINKKVTKKKAMEENKRITEQLLDGLLSPVPRVTSPTKSNDLPTISTPTTHLPQDLDFPPDSLAPELSFSVSKTAHSTPQSRDATNNTNKDNSIGWTVSAQIENLKLWLELQLSDLKGTVALQLSDLKGTVAGIAEDVKLRKRNKKVHVDIASNSIEAGGSEEISVTEENASQIQHTSGKLEVVCGNPRSKQHVVLELPSEAAVGLFHQTNSCLPQEPGKYASRLLDVFFSEEKLARSCCTKAAGRELLDQTVLEGIKYQTNFKYPLTDKQQAEVRWGIIVKDKLNMRCRTCRRKLAGQAEKKIEKENMKA